MPARIVADSASLGWGNAYVERWLDDLEVPPFEAPAWDHPSLVLAVGGVTLLETRKDRVWEGAWFTPGSLGLNPAGLTRTLRWRAATAEQIESVHIFLSATMVEETIAAFDDPRIRSFPEVFDSRGPDIATGARALAWALRHDAPALYADAAAVVLTGQIAAASPGPAPSGRAMGAGALRPVIDYMHENFASDVTLDQLAAVAHLSKYHLVRTFKASTGLPPHAYLRHIRLTRAATMLRATDTRINAVAAACGYRNASRFAAAFRRRYGASPASYRAANRI